MFLATVTVITAWGLPVWALILIGATALSIGVWLIIGVALLWNMFGSHRPTDENRKIVGDLRRLARDILEFSTEYDQLDPASRNIELLTTDREKYIAEITRFSTDAIAAYQRRFSTRVDRATRFLVSEGLLGPMDLFGFHINSIARKGAARKIDAAAYKYAERCGIDPENY